MKRCFIKLAKKNPKFWDIQINEKSYTVTEGLTGGDSETITNEFPNEAKCMNAVNSLMIKIRDKGYMELLPEYSEWIGIRKNYAIWRNVEAIESIIKIVKENCNARRADISQQTVDDTLDEILDNAKDLEIEISSNSINIRMMALSKYPYELCLFFDIDWFNATTPHLAIKCEPIRLQPNDKFKQLLVTFFNGEQKGQWFDGSQDVKSSVIQAEEQKKKEAYIKKLKTIVNSEYKKSGLNLEIMLSIPTTDYLFPTASLEEVCKDTVPVVFECMKSKVKKNYEEVLSKAYCMLYDIKGQLPLAKLKEALNELKEGKSISVENIYKDLIFEDWENPKFLKTLEINTVNKNDIKDVVAYIVKNIDSYLFQIRFLQKYIQVNSIVKGEVKSLGEQDFFSLVAPYPELEEYLVTYIEKLTKQNEIYTTYIIHSGSPSDIPIPIGVTAAAALAMFNNKHDKIIASFLNTIKTMKWYPVSCSTMRNIWKNNGATPDVPETIAVMTQKTP